MNRNLTILVAEDDENDVLLLKRAFSKNGINNPTHVSRDGADACAYLKGEGAYQDREKYPFPSIIITDLKMPRFSGFEILEWLKNHPDCHVIPVIVLSASRQEDDVKKAYQLGANAFLHKPSTSAELEKLVRTVADFWNMCEKPRLPTGC